MTIHDEKLMADRLNKHFVEVGPSLSNNLPPCSRDFSEYLETVDCVFNFSSITNDAVLAKILKLKSNKGVGPDNIPPNE